MRRGQWSGSEAMDYKKLTIISVLHALVVTVVLFFAFEFKPQWFSQKFWVLFALAWLAWPFVLATHPRRAFRSAVVAIVLSLAILSPSIPWLFAFSAWWVNGFGG